MVAPQRQDNIPSDGEVATLPTSAEPTSAQGQLLGDPGPTCCPPTKTSQGWVGSLRGKWSFEIHCGEGRGTMPQQSGTESQLRDSFWKPYRSEFECCLCHISLVNLSKLINLCYILSAPYMKYLFLSQIPT